MKGSGRGYRLVVMMVLAGLLVAGGVLWACYRTVKSIQAQLMGVCPLRSGKQVILLLLGIYQSLNNGFAGLMTMTVLYLLVRVALEPCNCPSAAHNAAPQRAEDGTCSASKASGLFSGLTVASSRADHVKL